MNKLILLKYKINIKDRLSYFYFVMKSLWLWRLNSLSLEFNLRHIFAVGVAHKNIILIYKEYKYAHQAYGRGHFEKGAGRIKDSMPFIKLVTE